MQNLFAGKHIRLFVISIIVLVTGYILLAQGPVDNPLSLSWAPLLLICGYCVLFPIAIILRDNEKSKEKK
jgi:hypothetical protein